MQLSAVLFFFNTYRKTKQILQNFTSKLNERWIRARRRLDFFKSSNEKWLDTDIVLPQFEIALRSTEAEPSGLGRPAKDFVELSDRAKRLKVSTLVETESCEKLTFAARLSLQKAGKRDAAKLINLLEVSPNRATKIKKALSAPSKAITKYAPEEALALYVDGHFTKKSYILMQTGAKYRNANIYPPYNVLQVAKTKCYPNEAFISVTDISAEVTLQGLVDCTAQRLLESQKEVLQTTISSQKYRSYISGAVMEAQTIQHISKPLEKKIPAQ